MPDNEERDAAELPTTLQRSPKKAKVGDHGKPRMNAVLRIRVRSKAALTRSARRMAASTSKGFQGRTFG